MSSYPNFSIIGITNIPEVTADHNLASIIAASAEQQGTPIQNNDILVIAQKIVSKAEGLLIDLKTIEPSPFAKQIADQWDKDARHVEVVLRESRRIVRMSNGILITETHHGFICANSGVDASNLPGEDIVSPLPPDPDKSATLIRDDLKKISGHSIGVIISDTFGRPWREGTTNIAIGIAGINPLIDYRGIFDIHGREMHVSISAIADEIAGATEIVMAKTSKIPAALLRGLKYDTTTHSISEMIRPPENDLFR
jgi:coenzyme F420-0:L-glutamate ligase/coenzyme F420-1:gamma-L-glutamate ligase